MKILDFRDVYGWFDGRIWDQLNCGKEICGDAECCGRYLENGEHTHIFFLPGELEFLKGSLGHRLPMAEVDKDQHFHCSGNNKCIYEMRPIDCRSYPLWPVVQDKAFKGFHDCRGTRCPIKIIPSKFISRLGQYWKRLLDEYPELANWLEEEFCSQSIEYNPDFPNGLTNVL